MMGVKQKPSCSILRQRREMKRRVNILHRAYDVGIPNGMDSDHQSFVADNDQVAEELCRRHIASPALRTRSQDFANRTIQREPNPCVRAVFGVERAGEEGLQALWFNHCVPGCFVNGAAYKSWFDPLSNRNRFDLAEWNALGQADRQSIIDLRVQGINPPEDGVISARWSPDNPSTLLMGDSMRPPLESLAIAAQAIRTIPRPEAYPYSPRSLPAVLGIGLGFGASAQALSLLLPFNRVYHQPIPYCCLELPSIDWEAVILNAPSRHAWQVADLLSQKYDTTFLQRRAILEGWTKGTERNLDGHVRMLLEHAIQHCVPGKLLIIMGDPEPYHIITRALFETGFTVPAGLSGLDTTDRGIWVDYPPAQAPWTPHRIPRPTGKVVSFWRWK